MHLFTNGAAAGIGVIMDVASGGVTVVAIVIIVTVWRAFLPASITTIVIVIIKTPTNSIEH